MSELQFVRVDGETLVLSDAEGNLHSLTIDDVLRSELRRSASPRPVTQTISPREIQESIREGASIDDLVAKHGADEAYVTKFAQPVLDELEHAVASAQQVRINLDGDRFSEVTQIEFGDLIARRLESSEATGIQWRSKRLDQHTWLITVEFELPSGSGHASWSFDPRRLALTPENDSALTLSSADALNAGPIPRLRPVTSDGQAKHPSATTAAPSPVSALAAPKLVDSNRTEVIEAPIRSTIREAIAKANVAEATPETVTPGPNVVDDLVAPPQPADSMPTAPAAPNQKPSPAAEGAVDLLDQLRKKRLERDASTSDELPHKVSGASRPLIPLAEPEPVTSSIRIINDEPLVEAEASQLPATEAEDLVDDSAFTQPIATVPDDKATEPKRGRAGIPSWDEIVFGTKTDD